MRLEKIIIEMCSNSEKSSNISENLISSLRNIRRKYKGNEQRIEYRENENDKKRSASETTNDREQVD